MFFSDELGSDRMCITGGGEAETRAAVRIHLFTLLFEECKILCANIIEESTILVSVTRLLDVTQKKLKAYQGRAMLQGIRHLAAPDITPKWLTALLLLLDTHEKVSHKNVEHKQQKS